MTCKRGKRRKSIAAGEVTRRRKIREALTGRQPGLHGSFLFERKRGEWPAEYGDSFDMEGNYHFAPRKGEER